MYNNGLTAYLGDEYSYSHEAATRLAGGTLVNYETITKAIAAAECGECDQAVVPFENNVEGAVNEVYDALFDSELFISRQTVLPIRHSLIGAAGASVDKLKLILSHPQAIAQCRKYLTDLPVTVQAVASTSDALKRVDGTTAAIAFKPRDGQAVLVSGIQDSALNATRFALLKKQPTNDGDKVSISFDLKNESGTLLRVLRSIYDRGVNMTRILSRPHRSGNGEYRFFVDFDFSGDAEELDILLKSIERNCSAFRFLGRYYCDQGERRN